MTRQHSAAPHHEPKHRRTLTGMACLLALSLLPGCGNLTAGGFGEARVVANGDAPDPTAPVAAALATAPARAEEDDGEEDVEAEGELDLLFRLYLESDDGIALDLSQQDLQVDLDLEGTLEPEVVTSRVPTGVYTALRVVFREVEIEVENATINGQPIPGGEVEIEIEDLTVERPLNITVLEGSTVEILLDLNAATWLQWLDTSTQPYSVRTEDFADAFSVRVR